MNKIQVSAILDGASSLKDGGLSVRFHTQELSAQDKLIVLENLNQFGWLLFSINELQPEEIPETDAEFKGKKQSQRIRNSLFVLWDKSGRPGKFDDFYRDKTDKIIEWIKNKIEVENG